MVEYPVLASARAARSLCAMTGQNVWGTSRLDELSSREVSLSFRVSSIAPDNGGLRALDAKRSEPKRAGLARTPILHAGSEACRFAERMRTTPLRLPCLGAP